MTTLDLSKLREAVATTSPEAMRAWARTKPPADQAMVEMVLSELAGTIPHQPGPLAMYHDLPAEFARDLIEWPAGQGLVSYQAETLNNLIKYGRESVRGPRGLGKSATAALAVLWFALTREDAGEEWKIPTTASAWGQLSHFLWPEIHKWAGKLKWDAMGREPFTRKELLKLNLKLAHGEAFSASPHEAGKIEGAHADHIFYLYDEAKRLDIATPIATPDGWTTMGELTAGDVVFDEMGHRCNVTMASAIRYDRPCLRVEFEDGQVVVADDGHLWAMLPQAARQSWGATHRNDPRYRKTYEPVRDWRRFWDNAEVVETSQLKVLPRGDAIPTCMPLELPEIALPIDPYTLGVWLGDGSRSHGSYCSMDPEVADRIRGNGLEVTHRNYGERASIYRVVGLQRMLRLNGLIRNKHVPGVYLRASAGQRLELLRGLMDTDGTVMGTGRRQQRDSRVSFTNTNEQVAQAAAELVRSLGWKVHVRKSRSFLNGVEHAPAYCLRWSADVCVFHIPRKAERWVQRGVQASASTIRTIRSIERIATVPTRCIAVDSPRSLYLAGEGMIPTHNSIPDALFDSTEGAFSNAGPETGKEALALAISTPGEPQGRFYNIHRRAVGLENWHARHIQRQEAIDAGQMSETWADQVKLMWGAESALYQRHVEGEFASDDEDGVIPLGWVEMANQRWRERFADGFTEPGPLEAIGVDCSGAGQDRTVIAARYDDVIGPLERPRKSRDAETGDEEMATAGRVVARLSANPKARAIIDAVGDGAGVVGRVREEIDRKRVIAFIAGAKSKRKDRNGELGFADQRAAAWWNLREMLDPEHGTDVCLPPDDELTGDLTAPHWREVSGGKIRVESKDDIRARIGRSTDAGDAVVQSMYRPEIFKTRVEAPSGQIGSVTPQSVVNRGGMGMRPR